ncbi:hypothetical protein ACVRZD_08590 [Streptococcus hongkongensis]
MEELNLTPLQYIIFLLVLLLLMVILSHFKSYTVIDIEEDEQERKQACNHYYGAYLQNYNKYYN